MKPITLSIVLPVYRQADHITSVVEQFLAQLTTLSCPFEILLIPNGPDDGSLEQCRVLEKRHNEIHCYPSPHAGWGTAVRLGLEHAQGAYLCYANSARTRAEDLCTILELARKFPGAVIKANRKIRESLLRRLASLLFNLECRTLFDLSYWDINGTPKVFPRSCSTLMELREMEDLIDLEFLLTCQRSQYPVIEVPLSSMRRHGGMSTTNISRGLQLYWGVFDYYRRIKARKDVPSL